MANPKRHPGILREQRIGSGTTKGKRFTFSLSHEGIDWYAEQTKGKFWVTDFTGSLDNFVNHLREQAKALPDGLPDNAMPWFQLMKREFQSKDWYIGALLQRIDMVRDEMQGGDSLRLAGSALKLGSLKREYALKFQADPLIRRYEDFERKHSEGISLGNETKTRNAKTIAQVVRRLFESDPNIDLSNLSDAWRRIKQRWPDNVPRRGPDTIKAILRSFRKT